MKQTVDLYDFRNAFEGTQYKDNFSYEGLEALFNWLEDYESDTGQEIELDVVAIACDFTEYENLEEFQGDYSEDYRSIEDITQETNVIMIDEEAFIIQDF